MLLASLLAANARADGTASDAQSSKAPSFWTSGPAGGAFGVFVESGATAGLFGPYAFAAGSWSFGASLRWFEVGVGGYGGASFDGWYSAYAFTGRASLRLPLRFVALSLGVEWGYVDVSEHTYSGWVFEPTTGVELDPVCHLRLGVLGAVGQTTGALEDRVIVRGALTVGYVMGRCSRR